MRSDAAGTGGGHPSAASRPVGAPSLQRGPWRGVSAPSPWRQQPGCGQAAGGWMRGSGCAPNASQSCMAGRGSFAVGLVDAGSDAMVPVDVPTSVDGKWFPGADRSGAPLTHPGGTAVLCGARRHRRRRHGPWAYPRRSARPSSTKTPLAPSADCRPAPRLSRRCRQRDPYRLSRPGAPGYAGATLLSEPVAPLGTGCAADTRKECQECVAGTIGCWCWRA